MMTCEEFRDRWEDRDRQASEVLEHRSECATCDAWVQREAGFEGMMLAAMVVGPPPELSARLAQIPATVYRSSPVEAPALAVAAPSSYNLALEAIFIALVGFAAIAVGGFDPMASVVVTIARIGDVLQAIPLVLGSPLVPYLQSLTFTAVEALATLVLVGLSVARLSSDSVGRRPPGEAV